jgi:HAD superfamily hydrolase (TIGR01509 family)
MPLKAILWDLDGVIADSGEIHYQAWTQLLTPMGVPFSRETFRSIFGMNNTDALSRLFDPVRDAGRIRALDREKEALFRKLAHSQLELLPGVWEWLTFFKSQGLRQAIASSAPAENIEVMVAELEIREFFDALVSGAKIPGKPDPSVFLLAAHTVGVEPADCLVVEDAVAGVEAASRAGMKSVAVLTTSPAEALHKASLIIPRLSDLKPERVNSLLWPE